MTARYQVRDIDGSAEIAALKAERDLLTIIADAIQAERDRLRAALEEILHAIEALPGDGWSDGNRCKAIARRALGGK